VFIIRRSLSIIGVELVAPRKKEPMFQGSYFVTASAYQILRQICWRLWIDFMIKMLLVDDDKIVLEYLSGIMDWMSYGIDLVATALNGKQGLLKYEEHQPQLIISDVKMPFMDGLEMLRQIRMMNASVYFVVLTSYGEFSYAKEAMAIGASAYLLKNEITEDMITAALDPIILKIRDRAQRVSLAIQREIHAFITNKPHHLPTVSQAIQNNFDFLHSFTDEVILEQLGSKCIDLFRNAYKQYGKEEYFLSPGIHSVTELRDWVLGQLEVIHQWAGAAEKTVSLSVSNAMTYIQNNYADKHLNIKMVAEGVFLSPNWLSAIFKKETGKTVNDYITCIRVRKAKELLRQGKYRVYEIADLVGYGSSQYFSRVFFQSTGQTPQNYRKEDCEG